MDSVWYGFKSSWQTWMYSLDGNCAGGNGKLSILQQSLEQQVSPAADYGIFLFNNFWQSSRDSCKSSWLVDLCRFTVSEANTGCNVLVSFGLKSELIWKVWISKKSILTTHHLIMILRSSCLSLPSYNESKKLENWIFVLLYYFDHNTWAIS